MNAFRLLCFLLCTAQAALAQTDTKVQTITGVVRDRITKQTLPGASVRVKAAGIGGLSDENGRFRLEKVPVGRVSIEVQLTGYEAYTPEAELLSSAKSLELDIELTPAFNALAETVVLASRQVAEPLNESAVVSARSFTVDETKRVAAAVNDPGRVALSYAGVQKGENDTENQIVIRGNSPVGVLWRLEGIDIPNPNHFALIGSSGGGLTVFSAQLLSRSDFFSGGMPAEYGNALSGAFDMHFRQGNKERRAWHAGFSLLGLDLATEGPIRKGRSSYLVNYRYSTLDLLNRAGFQLVGERVNNVFQDLSFNLAFNSKNNRRTFTLFGISGLSEEHYFPVENGDERDLSIANHWEDRVRPANMGALGATWTWLPDDKSYLKVVAALMGSEIRRANDTLDRQDVRFRYETQRYLDRRFAASAVYSRKLSTAWRLKTGAIANIVFFDFYKNVARRASQSNIQDQVFGTLIQGEGNTQLLQQYAQLQWTPARRWKLNAGYHLLYLAANGSSSAEPRLSVQYELSRAQRLSFACGLYSKTLPLPAYFAVDSAGQRFNNALELLKSAHYILSWSLSLPSQLRFGVELYAQHLFNVPAAPQRYYWMLNNSEGFPELPTTSTGQGWNKGIDLTVEKALARSWLFILNGSFFSSEFGFGDDVWRPTVFNNRFSTGLTLVKEFNFRKNRTLQLSGRYLYSGGYRFTPYDPIASAAAGRYVSDYTRLYEGQSPDFRRLDLRIAWLFNKRRMSGAWSLDVQNALNKPYATGEAYDAIGNKTYTTYQGELVPVLSFQVDF